MGAPVSPLPAAWCALPLAFREGVAVVLQRLADERAEADGAGPGGVSGAAVVTLLACEGAPAAVTVSALLSHMIWHATPAGSDRFAHEFYRCTACFVDGVLAHVVVEHHRQIGVSEYDEQTHYDRGAAVAAVIASLRATGVS